MFAGMINSMGLRSADGTLMLGAEHAERLWEDRVSKSLLERMQLEKFRYDYLMRHRSMPCEAPREGGDPPDFLVLIDGVETRLDLAALTIPRRREQHKMFSALVTDGWLGAPQPAHAGLDICISFNLPGSEFHVPSRRDKELIRDAAAAIRNLAPDRAAYERYMAEHAQSGLPAALPLDLIRWDDPAGRFGLSWNFTQQPAPNLRLNLSTTIGHDAVAQEVQRVVTKHDKPEIEVLLLSLGSPDQDGYRYTTEEFMDSLLPAEVSADYLTAIHVHVWGSGATSTIAVRPSAF